MNKNSDLKIKEQTKNAQQNRLSNHYLPIGGT
jgi:hypothetical protein